MSSVSQKLFALIDWEDGTSLDCPITNIIEPRKDFCKYRNGDKILAKCPGFGNHYGVIAAIDSDRSWLKSVLGAKRPIPEKHSTNYLQKSRDVPPSIPSLSAKKTNTNDKSPKNTATNSSAPKQIPSVHNKKEKIIPSLQAKNDVSPSCTLSSISSETPSTYDTSMSAVPSTPKQSSSQVVRKKLASSVQSIASPSISISSIFYPEAPNRHVNPVPSTASRPTHSQDRTNRQLTSQASISTPVNLSVGHISEHCNISTSTIYTDTGSGTNMRTEEPTPRRISSEKNISSGSFQMMSEEQPEAASTMIDYTEKQRFATVKDLKNLKKEFDKEIDGVKEKLRSLKRKYKLLTSGNTVTEEKKYNGHTFSDLKEMIRHEKNLYKAALKILTSLFTQDYLVEYSVSGKAPNSKTPAKPKMNQDLYNVYCEVLREFFPTVTSQQLREKVSHVQKKFLNKQKKTPSSAS